MWLQGGCVCGYDTVWLVVLLFHTQKPKLRTACVRFVRGAWGSCNQVNVAVPVARVEVATGFCSFCTWCLVCAHWVGCSHSCSFVLLPSSGIWRFLCVTRRKQHRPGIAPNATQRTIQPQDVAQPQRNQTILQPVTPAQKANYCFLCVMTMDNRSRSMEVNDH